mgnify:FL=1|tara:strand:- start:1251 stop:1481 length:231 start_codon:yes stop_codon:yes gene_type:complete
MAKKEKEKPAVLTLNEKEYVIDEMTDDEKMLLNHINDMQSKINTNQFMRDQLEVGKEAFINKLRESLETEKGEEEK